MVISLAVKLCVGRKKMNLWMTRDYVRNRSRKGKSHGKAVSQPDIFEDHRENA